jgi:beta-glucosidase/6-phospho-beta-glucosidase/beta-galactosidase
MFVTINVEPFDGLDTVDAPLDQETLKAWLAYVHAVVQRYCDRVKYWEIHNEPKMSLNYAKVVKAASKTIKKTDPTAKIIAGSIARVNVEGLRLILEEGGVGLFIDAITYHPYDEFPEASKHVFLQPVVGGYTPAYRPLEWPFPGQ